MTGTGFKHLASVCAANVTCLSDSYWHAVATTLASDTAANEVSGAAGATARTPPRDASVATANAMVAARLHSTKNSEWSK